uniref:RELB proto-oncogene, NF-kB subunit n=1 Tax=Strix occidentalis caurina TaxID=311401 RepID=A0A8D0FIL8_STROC
MAHASPVTGKTPHPDPAVPCSHAPCEIIEEVMKEDGFQLDPAPVLPKVLPKGSAKLVARGSSPAVATRPLCPAEPCPYGATVLPADSRSPQLPPKLVITEQPKQRGMRFRYECEGRSAGSILGESSTDASKTLPAIELLNCQAIPEVKVTACLVWKDWPYRVHPHGLVGKDCSNGLCEVVLKPHANPKHSFSNLGIQCVKKKEIEAAIEKKLQLGIDPFKAGSLKNHQEVDMNVVRICFQASYKDGSGQTRHLSPVLSEPIFDKKSTNTSELRICRMNKESGPCTGGEELYLLCDKVQKEDIAVVFRKETWEARADFSQADVHRQVAIVFKTPPYQHLELAEPVEVEVFLQRLTDSVCSESFRFTYLPKDHGTRHAPLTLYPLPGPADPYGIEAKRRKKPPGYMDHFVPLPAPGGCPWGHVGGPVVPRPPRPEFWVLGVGVMTGAVRVTWGQEGPPLRDRPPLLLWGSPQTWVRPLPTPPQPQGHPQTWERSPSPTPRLGSCPWPPPVSPPALGEVPKPPCQTWILPRDPPGPGSPPDVGEVSRPLPLQSWVMARAPPQPQGPPQTWERSPRPPQPGSPG